jgi:endonuclease/exonuclease/phosphatase family metal-dependent hydrolase
MLFDLYTWNPKQSSRNKIFDLLEKEKPDILCLQEFYNSEEAKDFNNIDSLKKIFQDYFVHVEYSHTIRKNDHWGMITLSKFPILNRGKIDFKTKWNNLCIYTDVLIDSDTIRIYNTHLASIHFGKKEHSFLNNLMGDSNTDQLEESKGIIRLLKQGFQRRVGQVNLIDKNKSQCKYPMVICGDFNDPPASYAYKKLQQNLKDAFLECGSGIGSTYSGKLPTFRIDYILFDPMFECINYQELKVSYTDHFPVITYLRKIKG